jgi:hypothetical protein
MSTIIECAGENQAWVYIPQTEGDSTDPRTNTAATSSLPGCPECGLTAKDLKIRVSRKNGKLSPAKIPAHEVEDPRDLLSFVLKDGDFQVHVTGDEETPKCPILKRDTRKSDYERPGSALVEDPHDLICQLWDDQIRESWTQEDDPSGTPPQPVHPKADPADPSTEMTDPDPSDAWLAENGYTGAVHIHTCVAKLGGVWATAKGTGSGKGTGKSASRQAKRDLALVLVEAIGAAIHSLDNPADPTGSDPNGILAGIGGLAEARQCAAQWIHHFPADRDEWLKHLPRPQRSDWLTESETAAGLTEAPTDAEATDDTPTDATQDTASEDTTQDTTDE